MYKSIIFLKGTIQTGGKRTPIWPHWLKKKAQNEEIYLSSDDEDENTVDSEMDIETENDYINEHVITNEMPEDKNVRICEEEKSKEPVSAEDIPPDSKNGAVQGSLQQKGY